MILNQTLCSPVQKEKRREKRKETQSCNKWRKWLRPCRRERGQWQVTHSHTHKLTMKTHNVRTHTHTMGHIKCTHYTHINGTDKHTLHHDTNGLWLESISQKTSDTNGNHISGLVPEKKLRALIESFSRQKINKTFSISIISYNWREKKASQPWGQMENRKWAVLQERPWPSELHKTQWATGLQAPLWLMTTCTTAEDTDW